MNTEERDESHPKKVIPSIRRENTEQEGDRKPYSPSYERPEGNYERRPYNRPQDGSYNRPQYGGGYRPNPTPRPYNNGNNKERYGNNNYGNTGGYQNRPSTYGNKRPQGQGGGGYGNQNYNRQYGNNYSYNRPQRPQGYDRPMPYSNNPQNDQDDGLKKRRPRVGDIRPPQQDMRPSQPYNNYNRGNARPPQYGNNRPQGGYQNRVPRPQQRYAPNPKPVIMPKPVKYKEMADPSEPIRLNKFLSNAGVCSRREADEFIQSGIVTVNGQIIKELGTKITRQDEVRFKDRLVHIESKVYILLNKPKNTVTTSEDPQERRTVMDLVKNACSERIYPVGRLDRNTTGVLLLTNDGDLASKLTHPTYKKKKIYHVWLDKNVAIEDMEKIATGIDLEDGEIHADAISYASEEDKSQVGIEIHSGRNRIVRRIFESLGYHVIKLDRVYFAGLTKKNLGRGKWRYLNEKEVNTLRMGAFE
ncbi:MAG: rRNA pseudouridine synthase [Tannerellaceae bacterium]|jgi:23S rRNA pseudouridine2605 synthase|nr:rRNA pseudouridine synthase [Tannerellaceae bacterium]